MSRNTKIVLGIVAAVLLMCVCVCAVGFLALQSMGQFLVQSTVTQPGEVAAIGDSIVTYELPPGYSEQFGMQLFGFSVVAFADEAEDSLILLMQFPEFAGLDQAQMETQLREAIQEQTQTGDLDLQRIDQETVTIRDQEVVLAISEGTDEEGNEIRQITGVFEGRSGPTLLMILGPMDTWDQGAINAFLNSLR